MHRHLGKIIAVIILTTSVAFLFVINGHTIDVYTSFGHKHQLSVAMLIILTFLSGIVVASLVGSVFGIRASLRERNLRKQISTHNKHWADVVRAREYVASREPQKALPLLRRIIERDPLNIVARIELAKAYSELGDYVSSLSSLDEARQNDRRNLELLFLSHEMNRQLGNHIASFDNLSLILKAEPANITALEAIIKVSLELGRLEDARSYQNELIRIRPERLESDDCSIAEIEIAILKKRLANDKEGQKAELERLMRRFKHTSSALAYMGALEAELGNTENASKYFVKAFRESKDARYLEKISSVWLDKEMPDKCFSNLNSALSSVEQNTSLHVSGHLVVAATCLWVENIDAAEGEIRKIEKHAEREQLSHDDKIILDLVRIGVAHRRGRITDIMKSISSLMHETQFVHEHYLAPRLLPKKDSFAERE